MMSNIINMEIYSHEYSVGLEPIFLDTFIQAR